MLPVLLTSLPATLTPNEQRVVTAFRAAFAEKMKGSGLRYDLGEGEALVAP